MAKKAKIKSIVWLSKDVDIKLIDPTPNNYKIKTDLGKQRLQTSLNKFGLAGSVVVNPNKKRYTLIDGNSRLEEAKERGLKKISISYPSRPLTPKEFKEMSAMFDYAVAGEVDTKRIHSELGTTEDFFKAWGIETPLELLDKMGAKANVADLNYPDETKKDKNGKGVPDVVDIKMVQLFFTDKQEAEFRKMEEKGKKKFKTDNTTDFVYKALKSIKL